MGRGIEMKLFNKQKAPDFKREIDNLTKDDLFSDIFPSNVPHIENEFNVWEETTDLNPLQRKNLEATKRNTSGIAKTR
jgi:hypothetical protein